MTHHISADLRRGASPLYSPDPNGTLILAAIRRSAAGISRAELSDKTGLAPQTVTDVCQRLLDQGLVAETGTTSSGLGRPRKTLELVPASRYVLGIQIERAAITYVLLNLVGDVVAESRHVMPPDLEPGRIIALLADNLDRLVEQSGIDRSLLIGLGVATPGPIDLREGIVIDPPHLPGWHRVQLRDRLCDATGLPVMLDKDVIAAAVAERWVGAAIDSDNAIFVYLGVGVGVGSIVQGSALRGLSSNAGDVGHVIVDADGVPCDCGQRGCFSVSVSALTLDHAAVAAGLLEAPRDPGDVVAAMKRLPAICRAADQGDERAIGILRTTAARLARAIVTLAAMLDAELAIIGGPVWAPLANHLLPMVQRIVEQTFVLNTVHSVRVAGTGVGQEVIAIGAACLVLDSTFPAPAPPAGISSPSR